MKQPTQMGKNRTGLGAAPSLGDEMLQNTDMTHPGKGNGHDLAELRRDYNASSPAIGSAPAPTSLKGVAQTGMQMIAGRKPTVFMDRLGERLAFERAGTRLYDALLAKYDAEGSWDGGPSRDELQHFHDEELAHFQMLYEAVESLGGDPTAVTPSADVVGVAGEGLMKVIADPRTSLSESLDALLVAELADHDGWEMLLHLAQGMGQSELVSRFQEAIHEEDEHLSKVREWLMSYADRALQGELQQSSP